MAIQHIINLIKIQTKFIADALQQQVETAAAIRVVISRNRKFKECTLTSFAHNVTQRYAMFQVHDDVIMRVSRSSNPSVWERDTAANRRGISGVGTARRCNTPPPRPRRARCDANEGTARAPPSFPSIGGAPVPELGVAAGRRHCNARV